MSPHLVAAPDKFRGTATAPEIASAVAGAAQRAGWTADEAPMSDGGEGLLDALGGEIHTSVVTGPLGEPVEAEWRMLGTTAVVEMSRAAGRALVPRPRGDDPLRADTKGVGQLLLAARDAGARRIVVGCGGSATTDGGLGAYETMGPPGAWASVDIIVASDVTTTFTDAARIFGKQKGATQAQIGTLTERLVHLAARYRRETGNDVTSLHGSGAAGGLAGGLLALGARMEQGFELVAHLTGLAERIARADLVVTGEGHVDPSSFDGKVPGGVLALARASEPVVPVLCVAGGSDRALEARPPKGMVLVSLTGRFGRTDARNRTLELVGLVTEEVVGLANAVLERVRPGEH
jgi:glycerate 2-kinase